MNRIEYLTIQFETIQNSKYLHIPTQRAARLMLKGTGSSPNHPKSEPNGSQQEAVCFTSITRI